MAEFSSANFQRKDPDAGEFLHPLHAPANAQHFHTALGPFEAGSKELSTNYYPGACIRPILTDLRHEKSEREDLTLRL